MGQGFEARPRSGDTAPDGPAAELPPIDDPFLGAPGSPPRSRVSRLAISSVVAALLLGPLGAIAAVVFGWAARREIESAPAPRRGYALATIGMVLGACLTMAWGAALAFGAWATRYRDPPLAIEQGQETTVEETSQASRAQGAVPPSAAEPEPQAPPEPQPGTGVPKSTTLERRGTIALVDVGVEVFSLSEELARQRADASIKGETVLVMTTRDLCEPCRGVERALADPLMQTALAGVRLVRVDIDVFKEDLDQLRMPRQRFPAFYLLSLDLTPKDGIDGGEWDDDIAENIAPVLGAFIRGKHTSRRSTWRPLPGTGVRL